MTFAAATPNGRWRTQQDQETAGSNRFIAPGTETEGAFGMFEAVLRPGQGATPHYHEGFSESFYLTQGELRIRVGDGTRTVSAGDFVYVPRRGVHVFRNDAEIDAQFLMIFAPGAPREAYFREMAEAFADRGEPSEDELDEIARRHDQVNLRDPHWRLP